MNPATLTVFHHLLASVAEEMGTTLGRTAFSANIKERLDFSCAVFLGDGRLIAQAAHIPVHLGAMPASVRAAIERCEPFERGDVVILNDPYLGGTHLPDVTMVSPVFVGENRDPDFYVASRAHHADIGGMTPGSMPLSREIFQEGLIIPPLKIIAAGKMNEQAMQLILNNVRTPWERKGDLTAQFAAHAIGNERLLEITGRYGLEKCLFYAEELINYAQRLMAAAISKMPNGTYKFRDSLDTDGYTGSPITIKVEIVISDQEIEADFRGTSRAVEGNLNAVPAIVESAFAYVVRCLSMSLLELKLPMNHGTTAALSVKVEHGSLLDPQPPHAVAAGNVETSQRVVDVLFGAFAKALPRLVPAASQGTMNNLTFGGFIDNEPDKTEMRLGSYSGSSLGTGSFAYYETMGGGVGAGPTSSGGHGLHTHMSNTRNTPIESLESSHPVRVEEYTLRRGSGGGGYHQGGDGIVRTIRFLRPVSITVMSDRRVYPPYGLSGGEPGKCGRNALLRGDSVEDLPGKFSSELGPGDRVRIETPGGGGWGEKAL